MEKNGILVNGASGRIGRFVTYELIKAGLPVAALNDLVDTDAIVRNYTRRDTTHGALDWKVEKINEGLIKINDEEIKIMHEKDASQMGLKENGINIVEECSGLYDGKKIDPNVFLENGAQRVIMSYPAKIKDATIIMGVNQDTYNPEKHRLISNASCTTKALAAPLKVLLNNGIGIDALLMDTVHAATNSQRLLDFGDDYAALNQISTHKTGAAIATAEVIPSLLDKMDGISFRVPTLDGSFANLYFAANHEGKLEREELNNLLRESTSYTKYCGRLAVYEGKEAASTDIIGRTENSIVIASKTRVIPLPYSLNGRNTSLVSLVCGYDNERGPPKDQVLLTKYILANSP